MALGWGARGTLGLPWQDMQRVWKVAKPVSVPAERPGADAAGDRSGVWAWPQLPVAPKTPNTPASVTAIQGFIADPSAADLPPAAVEQGMSGRKTQAPLPAAEFELKRDLGQRKASAEIHRCRWGAFADAASRVAWLAGRPAPASHAASP
jgi:hypothetical protein